MTIYPAAPPISTALMLKMIKELGHNLRLCDRVSHPADPELAIPAGFRFENFRAIRGYVVQFKTSAIATTAGVVQNNDFMAYVAEPKLDLHANTYLIYRDTYYQIESHEPIVQYSKTVLQRLKLSQDKGSQSTEQPDKVINFNNW